MPKPYAPPITRIVCSGGGAKGVVYSGAYQALLKSGLLAGVEEISGSSAGAIIAAFMAVGMPTEMFRARLLQTNLKNLLGTRKHFFSLTKKGELLETFLRENIVEGLKKTLGSIAQLPTEDPVFAGFLQKLKQTEPKITFADLALLHHHFPTHFKKLTMLAVALPNGEVQVFNSERTPDVEVALACRASASIPILLQPVKIAIDQKNQEFIDGGVFDNLPADYFDKDNNKQYLPNQQREKTLVFAFGEGLNNKKNQVFQALYGPSYDFLLPEALLTEVITKALEIKDHSTKKKAHAFIAALEAEIKNRETLTEETKQAFFNALKKQATFLQKHLQSAAKSPAEWVDLIKQKLRPTLYHPSQIEKLTRDTLVAKMSGLNAPYKNTQQKEQGYQKVRASYPLRTVELRVGELKTTDFKKASAVARTMDALGYLDTLNTITNHDLHNPEVLDAEQFYCTLMHNFTSIYEATLLGARRDPKRDELLQQLKALETSFKAKRPTMAAEKIRRQQYYVVKERVEANLNSIEAFALSRAVELANKTITHEALFKETYQEAFKHTRVLAVSNVTGSKVKLNATSPQKALINKNMFTLYRQQAPHKKPTRTDKIFTALSQIPHFTDDVASESPKP